jgi:hypothetical protein
LKEHEDGIFIIGLWKVNVLKPASAALTSNQYIGTWSMTDFMD